MSVSAVEKELARRRWWLRVLFIIIAVLIILGVVAAALGGSALLRLTGSGTPSFASEAEHFKYGSIGSEPASGLPYAVWKALPALYPEEFEGRDDYSAFGFTYEATNGVQNDLPIGISRRTHRGVDLVWFNCAVCHASTVRMEEGAQAQAVLAMPANTFDLGRFIDFVLDAADDPRLGPDVLLARISEESDLGLIDSLIWRFAVMPRLREELLLRREKLKALKDQQPPWGPGRVDTFNPYKALNFDMTLADLEPAERLGASDFPSIFLQGPREGMQLHWDGNNTSLQERNLAAALGAGVTPETVDHASVERVAVWLEDLRPPPSPHRPDPDAVERGRALYMEGCASCHGYQGDDGYVFEGERRGTVEDIAEIGTDRARLGSYTAEFAELQKSEFFKGTPYQFQHFTKTNGYANAPLDGLWLRGPYLHNGAVPTLAALLDPPEDRPKTFQRGSDVVDHARGGFVSPPCDPAEPAKYFCFDTTLPGNGNGGHSYGTDLTTAQKSDLLSYLRTF